MSLADSLKSLNEFDINDLDVNNAGIWPAPIKAIVVLIVFALIGGGGYWFFVKDQYVQLERVEKTEQDLRKKYEEKAYQVANLEVFKAQMAEMEETFLAIRRYAGFLEGGLDEDYYHTDTTFLENLKEAAQNLKFLSNAFYLMCLQKSGGYQGKREALSLQQLAGHTALLFEDALEFRQITLHGLGEDEREQLIEQDTAMVRHVLWGVFFLLMRYADDSANIHFTIRQAENGVRLNADVSACLPGHIASMDEDMSTFSPKPSIRHGCWKKPSAVM